MRISVVIRVYNRGYIVSEAIESVLQQTFGDYELIIVDDGSVDNTEAVIASYADPRIRYLRHDMNRGVSSAGNTGLAAARGDIVAHLDSDDLWLPNYLAVLLSFLDAHPEVDGVFCALEVERNTEAPGDARGHGAQGEPTAFRRLMADMGMPLRVVLPQREMYLCLLESVPIKPTNSLIRRSAVERVGGYDETLLSGEDWDLYRRIAKTGRFGYVDMPLAILRVQVDSTLAQNLIQDKIGVIRWAQAERREHRSDTRVQSAVRTVLAQSYGILGYCYLKDGKSLKSSWAYASGFIYARSPTLGLRAIAALMPSRAREAFRALRRLGT